MVLAGAVAGATVIVRDDGLAQRRVSVPVATASAGPSPVAAAPADVTMAKKAPAGSPQARTLTVRSGTERADVKPTKATPAAMLRLLTLLLPTGRMSHLAVAADDDLRVQLYLDDGAGPAMVRVTLDQRPAPAPNDRGDTAVVTVTPADGDCLNAVEVSAAWPDGTLVTFDLASCLPGEQSRPTPLGLSVDEAIKAAADPRWGVAMDSQLVAGGARDFDQLPEFAG